MSMSLKRPSANNLKSNIPNKQSTILNKTKNKTLIVWSIFAVLLLIIAVFQFMGGSVNNSEQKKMEAYLREKYGQDFVVKNVRTTGNGFGVLGSVRADVYPESDPSLKFELRRPENKDRYDYDSFLNELWSKEGRKQVDDFVKKLGDVKRYSLAIRTNVDFSNTLRGYTPSFSEVQKRDQTVFSYTLDISSRTVGASNEPSDIELERAFKVVEFVKGQHSVNPGASYTYSGKDFGANNNQIYDQYIISVKGNDSFNSINQPFDLRKSFGLTYAAQQGIVQ